MITIKNTQKNIKIPVSFVRTYMQKALSLLGYPTFDVGIWFTTNRTMKILNKKYRHKNTATDILSFAYHAHHDPTQRICAHIPEDKNLGDLIISAELVNKAAQEQEVSFQMHLKTILLHGLCHLLGHDHNTQQDFKRMQALEQKLSRTLEAKANRETKFIK